MERQVPAIKPIKTKDLIPYARNSRVHTEDQVKRIAASIREFGFLNPVITDGKNGIVAGHGRVMAADRLGMEEVPCIEAAHLTQAQVRAYVIADNRLAELSTWDDEMLRVEIADLTAEGFDIDLIGFGDFDLTIPGEGGAGDGSGGAGGSGANPAGTLAERFGIAPFTVLDARRGWWQDRKAAWIALGIRSELGRGEGDRACPGGSPMPGAVIRKDYTPGGGKAKAKAYHDGTVIGRGGLADQMAAAANARRATGEE